MRAPFEGRIVSKSVDLGQFLARGQSVARISSTEAAEITLYLEDRDLAWIDVPGLTTENGSGQGSPALVRVSFAGQKMEWPARVVRTEANLDEKTRLTPVVVRVDQPYSRIPPLMPGLFARVEIKGRTQDSASLIPRSAVRQDDTVWIVEEGRIRFETVRVLRYQDDMALISPGLAPGTRVVASSLKVVTDGLEVRAVDLANPGNGRPDKPEQADSDSPEAAAGDEDKKS